MVSSKVEDNIKGEGPVRLTDPYSLALGNRISKNIRLTSGIFKAIYNTKKRINGIHITSFEKLDGLFKMEGTNKALSMTINMTHYGLDIFGYVGALTTGGFVVEIEGDPLIAGDHDLYTQVDSDGNRWLRLSNLIDGVSDFIVDKIVLSNFKEKIEKEGSKIIYDIYLKYVKKYGYENILPTNKSIIENHNSFIEAVSELNNRMSDQELESFKREVVDNYCKYTDSVLIEFKEPLKKLLFDFEGIIHQTDSYNEVVVNNIKVKKLLILKNKKFHSHYDRYQWKKSGLQEKFEEVIFADSSDLKKDKKTIEFLRSVYSKNKLKYSDDIQKYSNHQITILDPISEEIEVTPKQINHIDHLEDFLLKPDGFNIIIDTIEDVLSSIINEKPSKGIHINFKWDGSPGFVAGIDPETKRFFVALKYALTSKNPVLNFSLDDIKNNYNEQPGLIDKMTQLFNNLSMAGIKNVIQGDLLYTNQDKSNLKINGTDHVAFRANTVTYAVKKDSKIGEIINESDIGVVFHIEYNGDTLSNLVGSPITNTSEFNRNNGKIFIENPSFNNIFENAHISKKNLEVINNNIELLKGKFESTKDFVSVLSTKKISEILNNYYNTLVRLRERNKTLESTVRDLLNFISLKYEININDLRTEKGKSNKEKERLEFISFFNDHRDLLIEYYESIQLIVEIKEILLECLVQVSDISAVIKTEGKLLATDPEGFIVFNEEYQSVIKLINRFNFSYYNFNLRHPWE